MYTLYEDNEEFQAPGPYDPAGEVVKMSIREKLRSFLTRRPTQESLEKAGIIQGTSHSRFIKFVAIFYVCCLVIGGCVGEVYANAYSYIFGQLIEVERFNAIFMLYRGNVSRFQSPEELVGMALNYLPSIRFTESLRKYQKVMNNSLYRDMSGFLNRQLEGEFYT